MSRSAQNTQNTQTHDDKLAFAEIMEVLGRNSHVLSNEKYHHLLMKYLKLFVPDISDVSVPDAPDFNMPYTCRELYDEVSK